MSIVRDRRRSAYKVVNAFPEGWGKIPNNPLVAAAVAAIFKGGPNARSLIGGWSEEPDGRLAYRHLGKRGGQIVVYVSPPKNGNGDAARDNLERQWSFIEEISPLSVDVLLAVFAQLCEPSLGNKSKYPLLAPVAITAAAILKYKGLKRWGEEGAALRRRVDMEIGRLLNLRFDVHQFPAWDPDLRRWNAKGVSVSGDRLFDVVETVAHQSAGVRTKTEVVWLTRLGHWSQWWMNAQAKVWLGPMPRSLLALDHRRNRGAAVLAKKISLNTMVLWGAVRARSALARRIDSLLEGIGELPDLMSRDSHWGGRTRDRFDEAILMLQEAGVFTQVEWPEAFQPGDRDRYKGWVDSWLSSKIVLHRPPAFGGAEEGAQPKAARRKARRHVRQDSAVLPEVRRGSAIRALRASRNMSQLQLARELGISAPYLSQIENEKRVVSKGLLIRLSTWLGDDTGAGTTGGVTPFPLRVELPGDAGGQIAAAFRG